MKKRNAGPQPYFPEGTFHPGNQRADEFVNRWYGANLMAMEEEPLYPLQANRDIHRYRFLWLRTFDRPVCVVLSIHSDGTASFESKEADGDGGYGPGKLALKKTGSLSTAELSGWLASLEKAEYWSLPTSAEPMGRDGAMWILEAVKDGRYHIVDRWSPESGEFRAAAMLLMKMTGVKMEPLY